MPDRNPTHPLFQSLRLRKTVAIFFVPFCIVMPTHGKREVGGNFAEGEGGNRKCEMMMMGDDDEMNNFLHSLYNGILRARG
jgi:hypothetical protein